MFNPFKKRYTITEYKNQNGKTKFNPKYCSFISDLFGLDSFITSYGDLGDRFSNVDFLSLESAKEAIEKHKNKQKDIFKPSTVHYVK